MVPNWTEIAFADSLSMPNLRELESEGRLHIELLAFRNMLTGQGVPYVARSHAHAHYKNLVRVVDTAVRRYQSARDHLQRALDRPPESTGVADVVRALSDLEAVFNLLHRGFGLLVRLKRARRRPFTRKTFFRSKRTRFAEFDMRASTSRATYKGVRSDRRTM